MSQLQIVPRISIRNQARRAVAQYQAEQNGVQRLSDAEISKIDDLTTFERIGDEITIDHHERPGLTWKDVLDCKLPLNRAGAARRAMESNYRFFVYEGEVYFVSYCGLVEQIGYEVGDIGRNGQG